MQKILNDLKETARHVVVFFNTPITNLLVGSGVLLLFCSFIQIEGYKKIFFLDQTRWLMFICGFILIMGGVLLYIFVPRRRKINKKVLLTTGMQFKTGSTLTRVQIGRIQDVKICDRSAAVILPVNSSFVDDCITDKRSATGAYITEHFADKIEDIKHTIKKSAQLQDLCRNDNGTYPIGSTLILPSPYDSPIYTIVTASTQRKEKAGIKADPSNICECMRQIFLITSDKKISNLRMPIIGSGHGGMDIDSALILIVLTIKHYSRHYHHIKNIDIIVAEKDTDKLKDIYNF